MLALYISALPDPSEENKYISFYEEYKQILLKVAYDHIHDLHLAEDCVHEVLLYIAQHFEKIGEVKSPESKGYDLTITRAYANKFYKETQKEIFLEDLNEEPDDGVDYVDVVNAELDVELVTECIENLNAPYREVFILRMYHDLSFAEIAEMTGLTEAYVRKVLERAKKKIQKELKNKI